MAQRAHVVLIVHT